MHPRIEEPLAAAVREDLEARGWAVEAWEPWHNRFGGVGAVVREGEQLRAGADPREETWAVGD